MHSTAQTEIFIESGAMLRGFTLIELSIVLVIIGLVVGGVLVGRDLIETAIIRTQMSQIEKYQTAVNTFRGKYGGLPGDLPDPAATSYGFQSRGSIPGMGDGNGLLQGSQGVAGSEEGTLESMGELSSFWVDLSQASLIDGGPYKGQETSNYGWMSTQTSPGIADIYPRAKIGQGNFVYVFSGGPVGGDGFNYFGISALTNIGATGGTNSTTALTVLQASRIDTKMDDGYPQSGKAIAVYLNNNNSPRVDWAAANGAMGASTSFNNGGPTTVATGYDPNFCYDNNGVAGVQLYEMRNATSLNCALAFKFQ